MIKKTVAAVAVAGCLLGGCVTDNNGSVSREEFGTGVGAIGGALVGSFFGKGAGKAVAVLTGAALGGFIGNRIGAKLDEDEKRALAEATQEAAENAPTGERIEWETPVAAPLLETETEPRLVNDESSPEIDSLAETPAPVFAKNPAKPAPKPAVRAKGWVLPKTDPVQLADGRVCRDMEQGVEKDGQIDVETVTMCRQKTADGARWVLPKA